MEFVHGLVMLALVVGRHLVEAIALPFLGREERGEGDTDWPYYQECADKVDCYFN